VIFHKHQKYKFWCRDYFPDSDYHCVFAIRWSCMTEPATETAARKQLERNDAAVLKKKYDLA